MTPSQTRHYWRWWGRAASAAGWQGKVPTIDHSTLSNTARQVVETGNALAERAGEILNANTLRHACHAVAIGSFKSSKRLTNAELDRVLLVFRLVADGDDLSAAIALEDPDQGSVKRLTWSIRQLAPEALIARICRDKFARADWHNLDAVQLRQLLMTLKRRSATAPSCGSRQPWPLNRYIPKHQQP